MIDLNNAYYYRTPSNEIVKILTKIPDGRTFPYLSLVAKKNKKTGIIKYIKRLYSVNGISELGHNYDLDLDKPILESEISHMFGNTTSSTGNKYIKAKRQAEQLILNI